MNEILDGGSLDEQFLLAEEEKKKLEEREKKLKELIQIRNIVITELENKYHFSKLIQCTENTNILLDVLIEFLEEDDRVVRNSVKERVIKIILNAKTEYKDFTENFRGG